MGHLVQPSCRSRVTYSKLHRTLSRRVLNISREGESTTSLGSLFQCSVTLRGKKFFLMFRRNFLCFSLCPLPLVLSLGTRNRSDLQILVLVLGTMGTFNIKKKSIKSCDFWRVENTCQHGLEKPSKRRAWLSRTEVRAVLDTLHYATRPWPCTFWGTLSTWYVCLENSLLFLAAGRCEQCEKTMCAIFIVPFVCHIRALYCCQKHAGLLARVTCWGAWMHPCVVSELCSHTQECTYHTADFLLVLRVLVQGCYE